jgi:hypothetical protein
MAGYKLFFVSAQGKFWECSMVKTEKHIMDIALDDLYANYRKKPCQVGCGVYCAVSTSLLVDQPVKVIGKEIVSRAKRVPALIRNSFAGERTGAQHVNGGGQSAPPAESDESLVGYPSR